MLNGQSIKHLYNLKNQKPTFSVFGFYMKLSTLTLSMLPSNHLLEQHEK
jgi:hypothetical protein